MVQRSNDEERIMSLRINSGAPNFTADTTQGVIHFHDWIGSGWAILFSHPKDFTAVCTTDLGYMAGLSPSSTSAIARSSG
jgi:alkyl hydroperoxide reductase subunit AhpC